jgi:hypothetical protein
MGMSIDEIISILDDMKVKIDIPKAAVMQNNKNYALDMAIDTMRKYQKIEDIVRDYYNEQYTDKLDIEIIEMISEVLEEDGRWED